MRATVILYIASVLGLSAGRYLYNGQGTRGGISITPRLWNSGDLVGRQAPIRRADGPWGTGPLGVHTADPVIDRSRPKFSSLADIQDLYKSSISRKTKPLVDPVAPARDLSSLSSVQDLYRSRLTSGKNTSPFVQSAGPLATGRLFQRTQKAVHNVYNGARKGGSPLTDSLGPGHISGGVVIDPAYPNGKPLVDPTFPGGHPGGHLTDPSFPAIDPHHPKGSILYPHVSTHGPGLVDPHHPPGTVIFHHGSGLVGPSHGPVDPHNPQGNVIVNHGPGLVGPPLGPLDPHHPKGTVVIHHGPGLIDPSHGHVDPHNPKGTVVVSHGPGLVDQPLGPLDPHSPKGTVAVHHGPGSLGPHHGPTDLHNPDGTVIVHQGPDFGGPHQPIDPTLGGRQIMTDPSFPGLTNGVPGPVIGGPLLEGRPLGPDSPLGAPLSQAFAPPGGGDVFSPVGPGPEMSDPSGPGGNPGDGLGVVWGGDTPSSRNRFPDGLSSLSNDPVLQSPPRADALTAVELSEAAGLGPASRSNGRHSRIFESQPSSWTWSDQRVSGPVRNFRPHRDGTQ